MHVPELGYRPTLPTVLRRAADLFNRETFLVTENDRVTFRDIDDDSRALAKRMLGLGIGKGTRVGLFLPSSRDWVVSWAAAARVGALVMPFSTLYRAVELRQALRLGDVDTLIVRRVLFGRDQLEFLDEVVDGLAAACERRRFLDELPYMRRVIVLGDDAAGPEVTDQLLEAVEAQVTPSDECTVIFTSGTTAEPKAVVHTHGALVRKSASLTEIGGYATPRGRIFIGMPLFWVGGIQVIAGGLQLGTRVVCQERFDAAAALELIEREEVTTVSAWPNLIARLREHPSAETRDLSKAGMLAVPAAVLSSGLMGHSQLGMTESLGPHSAGARSGASPEERARPLPERLRGSFGAPLPGFEHRIVDPATGADASAGEIGEIWVRGYSMMTGFYKRERIDVFDDDGWFHTGDLGYLRDGYLFFTGRLSEMIKTRGANVSPREVELVLEQLADIGAAFVVGVPDDQEGERVAAAVVLADGAALDVDELRSQLREVMSPYKVPSQFLMLQEDEVPWLATGKPDKTRIRERLARSEPS
jgi:acyl-CoA synthetase (AMP-forming)/AMP-acid ligase II